MSEEIQEIANLDRLIYEPSRLAIMATLKGCESADFKYLQSVTGLSKSNLSMQLAKLEAHGLIVIEKSFVRKTARTDVQLSKSGRTALRKYWELLRSVLG